MHYTNPTYKCVVQLSNLYWYLVSFVTQHSVSASSRHSIKFLRIQKAIILQSTKSVGRFVPFSANVVKLYGMVNREWYYRTDAELLNSVLFEEHLSQTVRILFVDYGH